MYSGPTPAELSQIPHLLTQYPQFVLWRGSLKQEEGKPDRITKEPFQADGKHFASSTDPTTWQTFAWCVAALPTVLETWEDAHDPLYRGGGLGFVFTDTDPFCGIDLDHCLTPTQETVSPDIRELILTLNSYTELSPYGQGLHILTQATLPPGGHRKDGVEMYDRVRFFTLTGKHLPQTPADIQPAQAAVTALWQSVFAPPVPVQTPVAVDAFPQQASPPLSDSELILLAKEATNGTKFLRVYKGDTSDYPRDDGSGDSSRADEGLCEMLSFWTQDAAQLDRLFRTSGLMRKKWDTFHHRLPDGRRQTYGEHTVAQALTWRTKKGLWYRPSPVLLVPPPTNGSTPPPSPPGMPDTPLGDVYNAEALLAAYGEDLRFCAPWKTWLVWTGTHWERDSSDRSGGALIMTKARATLRLIGEAALTTKNKQLRKHFAASMNDAPLSSMVRQASRMERSLILPDAVDQPSMLLNCPNGTIDLTTGTLRPHDKAEYLSRCLSIAYDPDALCPTWDSFLWQIMDGERDPETADRLIAFLWRAVGYSLTSDTREQCLFLLHGTGANGKSTFLQTLHALLGPYAQSAPSSSLMAKDRQDNGPTNDIARLHGVRFLTAVEIGQHRRLDEELVKRLTGQDTLTARFLHSEFFDFVPTFKLFVACNDLPAIRGTDHAIWRRLRRIPFTVTIPDTSQDKTLGQKLLDELPGILAWCVRGCLDWQRAGLQEPDEVKAATEAYKDDNDKLKLFLDECCTLHPGNSSVRAPASALYKAYTDWCSTNGESSLTQTAFGRTLSQKGFPPEIDSRTKKVWRVGIELTR